MCECASEWLFGLYCREAESRVWIRAAVLASMRIVAPWGHRADAARDGFSNLSDMASHAAEHTGGTNAAKEPPCHLTSTSELQHPEHLGQMLGQTWRHTPCCHRPLRCEGAGERPLPPTSVGCCGDCHHACHHRRSLLTTRELCRRLRRLALPPGRHVICRVWKGTVHLHLQQAGYGRAVLWRE